MSAVNGGSLEDCVTNLFALTELNGLQWRLYESPPGTSAKDPRTMLKTDSVFVAYNKLQKDGILSVWRRIPTKEMPQVFSLPALYLGSVKELWVFWYGNTEPPEIEKYCKDLIKRRNEENENEDGTPYTIPYDVRCLLYKAWNAQIEKHYRAKKFLQIGRWFFRPLKFLDPNAAFTYDDFAVAHTHTFNVVGGNSMCMAIKTQLQPNLVYLSPFHIERNLLFTERVVNVLLAPWSLKGQIILRYPVTPKNKGEKLEVDRQMAQWRQANMLSERKKVMKRQDEDIEMEESEDEEWGERPMPKMVRVEVEGGLRMWWPTQYVLVTLEETRKLVKSRFPVSDELKCVPVPVPRMAKNRYRVLTNNEAGLRISQAAADEYSLSRRIKMGRRTKKRMSYSARLRQMLEKKYIPRSKPKPKVIRLSSVDDEEVEEVEEEEEEVKEEGKEEEKEKRMKVELKKWMKMHRYNWRRKGGRPTSAEAMMRRCVSPFSDPEDEKDIEKEKEWMRDEKKEKGETRREMMIGVENACYHHMPPQPSSSSSSSRSKKESKKESKNRSKKEEREKKRVSTKNEPLVAKKPFHPFTPVSVLSPIDKSAEAAVMAKCIVDDMIAAGEKVRDNLGSAEILAEYGAYYDIDASAGGGGEYKYMSYHSRRKGPKVPGKEGKGRSMLAEIKPAKAPIVPIRKPHKIPQWKKKLIGGMKRERRMRKKEDKIIRLRPLESPKEAVAWPTMEESEDVWEEMEHLKTLENPGWDLGSDEEPSEDMNSSGSSGEVLQGLQDGDAAGSPLDDAGEGTSSVATNWNEEMEGEEEVVETNVFSATSLLDAVGPDSVLSPPASNERIESINTMYHRLTGGPHSVGDNSSLNKIYPTPPSILQVDICSPANAGGPHSQVRKEKEDSDLSDDEAIMREVAAMESSGEMRGGRKILSLNYKLTTRQFFDNTHKSEVPVSTLFGTYPSRARVSQAKLLPIYRKEDGQRRKIMSTRHSKVMAAVENLRSAAPKKEKKPAAAAAAAAAPTPAAPAASQPTSILSSSASSSSLQQPQAHSSMQHTQQLQQQYPGMQQQHPAAAHPMQQQQPYHPQYHQSQPGPSMMQQQQQPYGTMGYQQGAVAAAGAAGMRGMHYPPPYGAMQHGMQGGYPQQQQYGQMAGQQNPMMMQQQQQQQGYGMQQMRPPGYGYGAAAGAAGGMMQQQPQQMQPGYPQQGMSPQVMYRPGMGPQQQAAMVQQQQYGSPMGGMMGQYGGAGGQMAAQPGMMMPPQQGGGQSMIAGAPHQMGSSGVPMGVHPSYQMSGTAAAAATTAAAGIEPSTAVVAVKPKKRVTIKEVEMSPSKRLTRHVNIALKHHPIHLRRLSDSRRGKDPYVTGLSITPSWMRHMGNQQAEKELEFAVTEMMLQRGRKKRKWSFMLGGGPEGSSVVAAVMLQDTILNLHFDWIFDSCPICACTTSIRARELGVYISPPEVLRLDPSLQAEWVGPWHGMHTETPSAQCSCGFSAIRHRALSMRAGLFIEDSREATGDELNSGTDLTRVDTRKSRCGLWFDPSCMADRCLVEELRRLSLTAEVGKIVGRIRETSEMGLGEGRAARRNGVNALLQTVGEPGSPSPVAYILSQMDREEALFMGNSLQTVAHSAGRRPPNQGYLGDCPYFHPWGLQIASEMADPTELDVKCLLEDVKPLIEGAVREARKLPSTTTSIVEGPLTWRALAAKNVKGSSGQEEDCSSAEPVPYIEMSNEKEALRVAPTVIPKWEYYGLGPIDFPKDVLYIAVVPDDERMAEMAVVYMRRLSKMYETNLKLGRHVPYMKEKNEDRGVIVKEGVVRADRISYQATYGMTSCSTFITAIEKYATNQVNCTLEFATKLKNYAIRVEQVLYEILGPETIVNRDTWRECVAYALYFRRLHKQQKQKVPNKHDNDTDNGSPPASPTSEEENEGEGEKKEGEGEEGRGGLTGPLAEAMGVGPRPHKQSGRRPFGQAPAYSWADKPLRPCDWPDDDPQSLGHVVVVYLTLFPQWGAEGRDGDAARVATIGLVRAFNAVMQRLPVHRRGIVQLELMPMQRMQEVVGWGMDLDRLDRSSNLNTWQITNMFRNADMFPSDRPRIEDVLKEVAIGVYRKPRFVHRDVLKAALPKSMTKFGPASGILDWIERRADPARELFSWVQSVPYQLASSPALLGKTENKFTQQAIDELSLYISYCLVGTEFVIATVTDNFGARTDSAVLSLKPRNHETGLCFRSRNRSSVRDGLDKLWKFIEGIMMQESQPIRLVIGRLGKMGHGEFKAWAHVLSRSNLKRYSSKLRESCGPCNASGAPVLLSACLVSTEPEANLQIMPGYVIPSEASGVQPGKKVRQMVTPGDNTITHIMVFPTSAAIQLAQSADAGLQEDDEEFDLMGEGMLQGTEDMNDIMNELLVDDGGEKAGARNNHTNSLFDGVLDSGVQYQPLAAGWMVSTAPGGDLPDWFWSSCPSLKRRMPVHLRSSLHINEAQLNRSDDFQGGKKEKDSDQLSHALDSSKTDEVLRHVLEQYNDLSWLAIDMITQERRSCLPIHIQSLTRLHDTVLHLLM